MNPDDETLRTSWTLIARLKNVEDQDGWREFYELYRRVVVGLAIKSGLRPQEAEEVLQETMASVSKKIQDFAGDPERGSFRAWLLQLVRWRVIDQFRKRLPADPPPPRSAEESTGTSALGGVADPQAADLESLCDEEWRRALLERALQLLQLEVKAEHYQVFHLLLVEQRRLDEAASMVGRSAAQIYLIKFRLTRRLKRIIAGLRQKLD
jgi:RNA polymerase sigma-70 factor (ECF subfamily)